MTFIGNCTVTKRKAHPCWRYEQNLDVCWAEGAGVVLAGLQPGLDAVFVDAVGAAQWVAALAIHLVLTHQAEFTGPAGVAPACWSVHGGRRSLGGAVEHWSADGPWRGLASCQQLPDLFGDFLNGHAGQHAAGLLHLLEQRPQLSFVALREALF